MASTNWAGSNQVRGKCAVGERNRMERKGKERKGKERKGKERRETVE